MHSLKHHVYQAAILISTSSSIKRSSAFISVIITFSFIVALLLAGCGVEVVEYPDKEDAETRIEAERPDALPRLTAYLSEKYGFSEDDYTVDYIVPWIHGSGGVYINIGGNSPDGFSGYWGEYWQARIRVDGKLAYVNFSVVDSQMACDTIQTEKYKSDFEAWFRSELRLPEDCALAVSVDDDNAVSDINLNGYKHIYPAKSNEVSKWVAFFLPSENESHYGMSGYYDGEDLFSPINEKLIVEIIYPSGAPLEDFPEPDELSALFPQDKTGDIAIYICYKRPYNPEAETAGEYSEGVLWFRDNNGPSQE
jgi:hypothetical protein